MRMEIDRLIIKKLLSIIDDYEGEENTTWIREWLQRCLDKIDGKPEEFNRYDI